MTRDELERIVIRYMDSFTTMTIACCAEGKPWAADVFYARQGLDLIFFSSPTSRHCTAFSQNPAAAATIHGDYRGWKEIKGLQMEGQVERIAGATARARGLAIYLKRYPFVKEFFSEDGSISSQIVKKVAGVHLYSFRPFYILYTDNETGFGTRWKLQVQAGQAVGEPILV
jgi:uncharacterized protein YhbP (UPF0306 family)